MPISTGEKIQIPNSTVLTLRLITAATAISDGYDLGVVNGVSMILSNTYSPQTISFFVSVMPAFVAVGALAGAFTADKFGRKPVLIFSYVLLIAGAVIMGIPASIALTFAGRAIVGLGVGIGGVVGTVYMAEISPTKSRGSIVAQETLFLSTGLLLGYLSNYLLMSADHNYNVMLGIGAVLPAGCLIALLTVGKTLPESPHWQLLASAGEDEALIADADEPVVVKSVRQLTYDFFSSPGAVPALLIGVLQPLCGIGPILYFSDLTFSAIDTKGKDEGEMIEVEPNIAMSSLFIGVTKVVVLFVSTLVLMDRFGRRTLLLVSSALIVVSMAAIAAILTWSSDNTHLLLAAFCCAVASYAIGWNCVPSVYPSEVLPTKVRTFGISFLTIGGRIISVTNAFLFPLVGLHNANYWFMAFAIINVGSFALVWLVVKETLNKPLPVGIGPKGDLSDREEITEHIDDDAQIHPKLE